VKRHFRPLQASRASYQSRASRFRIGRPASWKLTATSPRRLLTSLAWFPPATSAAARRCGGSAFSRRLEDRCACGHRIDRMPATDPDRGPGLARKRLISRTRTHRRVAPASRPASSASSRLQRASSSPFRHNGSTTTAAGSLNPVSLPHTLRGAAPERVEPSDSPTASCASSAICRTRSPTTTT
jgi:hypothetical protein